MTSLLPSSNGFIQLLTYYPDGVLRRDLRAPYQRFNLGRVHIRSDLTIVCRLLGRCPFRFWHGI
jgi:hypothetical protein